MIRAASLALAAALLAGCTMSAEWWVRTSLERSGYGKAAAHCVASGVAGALTAEQLGDLRIAISAGDRPEHFAGAEHFVSWLGGRVDARTHDVIAHYARHCGDRAAGQ
ncbi:MAG TPA: hypothetical protein VM308_00470 [Sphingomicrobium sp.]|nr:hypothetical protein [Sphingomicrobium sp.]